MPLPPNAPRALIWAVAAVAAAAAGLVWLAMPPGDSVPDTAAAQAGAPPATPRQDVPAAMAAEPDHVKPTTPPWPTSGWLAPPAGGTPAAPTLTLAELREVHTALAAAPQAGADQAAEADAMFFADVARRFHQVLQTRQEAEPGELHALAQMLDSTLDTRLQRGDIHWADARLVKAAVLAVLRPQDAAVTEQVEDWEIRLRQGAMHPPTRTGHPPREGAPAPARP